MHPKIIVHRYRHYHHSSRYHVADQRDRYQRRRGVLREGLDDVHVN